MTSMLSEIISNITRHIKVSKVINYKEKKFKEQHICIVVVEIEELVLKRVGPSQPCSFYRSNTWQDKMCQNECILALSN